MRILPEEVGDEHPAEDKETRVLHVVNHAPNEQSDFPAHNVVDGGFLELVRYGVRKPDDPVILSTIAMIDAVLKVDTPAGPAWHRYNHDGYGQQKDGQPFTSHGVGRVWPLLSGERGQYELAAGRSPEICIRAVEGLASKTCLIPEQSWDEADRPDIYMWFGQPTGSAMPLMWAHAEYVKLLRSSHDGKVYDIIPEVAERYLSKRPRHKQLDVWKPNRHAGALSCRLQHPLGKAARQRGSSGVDRHKTVRTRPRASMPILIFVVIVEQVAVTTVHELVSR